MTSTIKNFMTGCGVDHKGRTIDDVLRFTNEELEQIHDYIQWLFPLTTPSNVVRSSPTLTEADVESIRRDNAAQKNLVRAAERMKCFYDTSTHWLVPGNHNHLRISRIIASLYCLHHPAAAQDFYVFAKTRVGQEPNSVTSLTLKYWERAASGLV